MLDLSTLITPSDLPHILSSSEFHWLVGCYVRNPQWRIGFDSQSLLEGSPLWQGLTMNQLPKPGTRCCSVFVLEYVQKAPPPPYFLLLFIYLSFPCFNHVCTIIAVIMKINDLFECRCENIRIDSVYETDWQVNLWFLNRLKKWRSLHLSDFVDIAQSFSPVFFLNSPVKENEASRLNSRVKGYGWLNGIASIW